MVTQVLALRPFGMVGSSQLAKAWRNSYAAKMDWQAICICSQFFAWQSPLAPSAQGEKLPMHQFGSFEVETKDDTGRGMMAKNAILQ